MTFLFAKMTPSTFAIERLTIVAFFTMVVRECIVMPMVAKFAAKLPTTIHFNQPATVGPAYHYTMPSSVRVFSLHTNENQGTTSSSMVRQEMHRTTLHGTTTQGKHVVCAGLHY